MSMNMKFKELKPYISVIDRISMCTRETLGYENYSNVSYIPEKYDDNHSIWMNEKENVILMDCGAGFKSGTLACMCLETGERFYSSYM